jgi:hypothetical protein
MGLDGAVGWVVEVGFVLCLVALLVLLVRQFRGGGGRDD